MSKKFIFTSNLRRNDTATVAVRLSREAWTALRTWMKTPDYHRNIGFPNGVRLYYRSKGWYRLDVTRVDRAIDKLRAAVSIIRKWRAEYDEAGLQDKRLQVLKAQHPTVKPVAYVDNGKMGGDIRVIDTKTQVVASLKQHVPASPHKLEALAATFSSRRN
jgi:hypothetical protein